MRLSIKRAVITAAPLLLVLLSPGRSQAAELPWQEVAIGAIGKLVGKGLIDEAKDAVKDVTRDVDERLEKRIKQAGDQADQSIKLAGDEARKSIGELRSTLLEVIDRAGKEAAGQQEKFFRELAAQQSELFRQVDLRIARFYSTIDGKLDRFEKLLIDAVNSLKGSLDLLVLETPLKLGQYPAGLYRTVGLAQGYRTSGIYSIAMKGRGLGGERSATLEGVQVTVNGKAIPTRFGGEPYIRVASVPFGLLNTSFRDTEFGTAELWVKGTVKKEEFENRRTLLLLPRFPVKYAATAEVPGEKEPRRIYLETPGVGLIEDAKEVAKARGTEVDLALGTLFAMVRERLPLGSHVIELPRGAEWKELKVQWCTGESETLYPGRTSMSGVTVAVERGQIQVTVSDPTTRGTDPFFK